MFLEARELADGAGLVFPSVYRSTHVELDQVQTAPRTRYPSGPSRIPKLFQGLVWRDGSAT